MPAERLPKIWRLHDLMPYRVREVLLVSSPYDAFILEQEGQLAQQLSREYRNVSQPASPRIVQTSGIDGALELFERWRFDLILLTLASQTQIDVNAFGRRLKARRPGLPVVLLALDRRELHDLRPGLDPEAVDGAFLWSGDSAILLAIIHYVEDRRNVEHDVERGNVRVIVVVEDSAAYYSSFLGMLYRDLIQQAHALQAEGANELLRRMQMTTRPKVLLATSYEEGVGLVRRYRGNLMAIVSDVRLPREGGLDGRAGIELARLARSVDSELPVLLQSTDAGHRERAEAIGAVFADKSSPSLLAQLHDFVVRHLGFGDFVFREEYGGEEVARARDIRELGERLATVPERSLCYHAHHDHFSIWLLARSEFALAERLRPRKVSDFGSPDDLRRYLVEVVRESHRETHRGAISDFDPDHFEHNAFSRIGRGSLGGKARGIAFLNKGLARIDESAFGGLTVMLPKTVVIAADQFDRFLEDNDLRGFAYTCDDDRRIARRFLDAELPEEVRGELAFLVDRLDGPLAVRSSSLLEDSMHQPFAGVYDTLMIANNAAGSAERLRRLSEAVKLVYASTFYRNAKSYLENTGHRIEEEKMAVIVQPVVGRRHGGRFYPTFSGVARSYNYYPIPPQKANEGVVLLALGLGRIVVDDGLALRFSPAHPEVLPQMASLEAFLDHSQRSFYALDLEGGGGSDPADLRSSVRSYDLATAEADGTLELVGSVYSADDLQLREDLSLSGPRVVSFHNLLKHRAIPLPEAVTTLLEIARRGLGGPVELEFACEMGDWGRSPRRGERRLEPRLYVLQMRPIAVHTDGGEGLDASYLPEDRLCVSHRALGHGVDHSLRDVVHVRRDRWDVAHHRQIAREIAELNETLGDEGRRYLLIGPGRWGSADPWLGIPVEWSQISNVRTIVEASPAGFEVEPSQGTHFFQNITSLGIGYLSLAPGAEKPAQEYLDWAWLEAQPAARETAHLSLVRFDRPLTVVLDGRYGRGVIVKPGAVPVS